MMIKHSIKPAFKEKNIPVIFASSQEYVPYLSVALTSLKKNMNPDYNYDIIVLVTDMDSISQSLLVDNMKAKNISLRFINVSESLIKRGEYQQSNACTSDSPLTFGRLLIEGLLSFEYKKIIYLDSDLVINADVSPLLSIPMEDKWVAAVRDVVIIGLFENSPHNGGEVNKIAREQVTNELQVLGLTEDVLNYFNAGVLVMNLEAFREFYTSDNLLDLVKTRSWLYYDQSILNKVCLGHVYLLDHVWNYFVTSFFEQSLAMCTPEAICDAYKKARKNPKIIHYAGASAPCRPKSIEVGTDLPEYFWKYARASVWYEDLLADYIRLHKQE